MTVTEVVFKICSGSRVRLLQSGHNKLFLECLGFHCTVILLSFVGNSYLLDLAGDKGYWPRTRALFWCACVPYTHTDYCACVVFELRPSAELARATCKKT